MLKKIAFTLLLFILAQAKSLAAIEIPIHLVDKNGEGKAIGTIKAEDATCGVLLTPNLHSLPPGIRGFHVHQKPSCADGAMAAGDHLDPSDTHKHHGPYQKAGHLGDLPVLIVNKDGTATLPILAPRFKLKMLKGRSLVIHAGEDNYADTPEKLGGGGARIACGVI